MLPSRLLFGAKPKTARQPGERLPDIQTIPWGEEVREQWASAPTLD
ncbi:hypothetical protein SHO565_58490 [Streptomyces sp. HO565]